MLSYQDERDSTPTCFKLRCGHAFHTKCIIECLQKTNHDCPNCNGSKDFEQQLTREGVLINIIKDLKKDPRVKDAFSEYNEIKRELQDTIRTLKNDVIEYSKKRKEELEFDSKHKYFLDSISNIKSVMREVATEKGPKYQAIFSPKMATNHLRTSQFERLVLNAYGYNYYRLKYKRIHLHL
jgi:hypothetical protein